MLIHRYLRPGQSQGISDGGRLYYQAAFFGNGERNFKYLQVDIFSDGSCGNYPKYCNQNDSCYYSCKGYKCRNEYGL